MLNCCVFRSNYLIINEKNICASNPQPINKMKTQTLSLYFLILFVFGFANAQKIDLQEMQTICNNKNFDATNKLLLAKNFEFSTTETTDDNRTLISWTCDQNLAGKTKKLAAFSILSSEGATQKAIFKFRGKEIYAGILNELSKLTYLTEKEEIQEDVFISNYSNPNFYLKISFKKTIDEEENNGSTYTAYEIQISKKGGVDDPNNGLKTELFENGKPKMEYTLKDGKKNGAIKYFNEDGTIAKSGFMTMGLEKGVFTEFIYENTGKLKQKEVGEMQDGKKKGKWLLNAVSNNQETNLSFTNFVDGLKEGSFSKVQNDSICFGSYKNDLLEGKYSVFTSEKNLELAATIETDTLKLKKVLIGFFSSNKKAGLWKTYDVDGTLSLEGNYENDKKTGKWSYYYSIYVDDNDKEMDYSGKLYLEENYTNGKLNGERKRYSILKETEFPCENDSSKKCSKIDFKRWIEKSNYENGLLNGDYELTNETNEIIEKGTFLKGKKTGNWQLLNDSKIVISNNKTIESGEFINDKKQGKWERLKNGKAVETYFYTDNFLDGEHICLNNGNPKEKRKFLNNKLTALELLDDAQKTVVKYNISESEVTYKCEKITFLVDGVTIKNFVVNKESDKPIDCVNFKEDFEKAQKIADGFYQKKAVDGKLLEEGNFKNNQKWGKWITFYYDQKVKTEFEYNDVGDVKSEFYFEVKKNEPFSGEFEFIYENGTGSEERKIKEGIRNGTTRYKDAKEKTIKKESYKDGVLKVKE